ncbi:MAG: phosphoribosylamine--glycine ligase [Gammaproteobacteria bacterium]|nr:phosphoribosylamine--glycine ligase [Gammaproteobacteria bacterium]
MKVLIVGGGGREHALAWKASLSSLVDEVLVAPGNAGTDCEPGIRNLPVSADDIDGLLALAVQEKIGLTIIGPETPLVNGICDRFAAEGLRCFGPHQAAAQLEGSKAFSKDFMDRHGIPTASYRIFDQVGPALKWLSEVGAPIVIKADGLAAGKGVVVATDEAEAEAALRDMLEQDRFGEAGCRVVMEEFLQGQEASFIVICDGEHILPLATSQDHKTRDDGDVGPNTGGMGAYSPAPVVTREVHERIMREIIEPTVAGMAADGHPYTGFLYAGLMIDDTGAPSVVEFNCRFGDPEAQPVMARLKSDLVALCDAALDGRLDQVEAEWDERVSLGVVMAAGGYPGSYASGEIISGLDQAIAEYGKVFHAGTKKDGDRIVTAGGRVLCVVALGDTVSEAQQRAYALTKKILWKDAFYRHDIGHRALAH